MGTSTNTLDPEHVRSQLFDRLAGSAGDMDKIIADTGNTAVRYRTQDGLFWVEYEKLSDRGTKKRISAGR